MEKIEFYDDGKYEKYNEINGIKQGKAVYYWSKNSALTEKSEDCGKIKEEFFYENGIKQGKAVTYFDQNKTKKIKEEFSYVDNIKCGGSFLLYSDKLEKRNYINGKIAGKILVYRIDGRAEVKNSYKTFKSLREILGIDMEKQEEKMLKWEYEELKKEAERRFNEMAYSYKNSEKKDKENINILSELFIKKYYLRNKEMKF